MTDCLIPTLQGRSSRSHGAGRILFWQVVVVVVVDGELVTPFQDRKAVKRWVKRE